MRPCRGGRLIDTLLTLRQQLVQPRGQVEDASGRGEAGGAREQNYLTGEENHLATRVARGLHIDVGGVQDGCSDAGAAERGC